MTVIIVQKVLVAVVLLFCLAVKGADTAVKKQVAKKSDPNDNKGNTPFFLQDPYDNMCLGPKGFTSCDESTLWVLTKRAGKKTYSLVSLLNTNTDGGLCLERKASFFGLFASDRVAIGSCNSARAKSWDFEFVDQTHVKLSTKGQCLVRGKKQYKSTVSVQSCKKGEFTPLVYHPTAVHEHGFFLKAADGTCFDGARFRSCDGPGSNKILWGVGIRYVWGEAKRYLFGFHVQDRTNCLTGKGSTIFKGPCKDSGTTEWALSQGQLTFGTRGNTCVARRADDTAALVNCNTAFEHISVEVPSVYTNEQLKEMLQSPVRIKHLQLT